MIKWSWPFTKQNVPLSLNLWGHAHIATILNLITEDNENSFIKNAPEGNVAASASKVYKVSTAFKDTTRSSGKMAGLQQGFSSKQVVTNFLIDQSI